jgi:N,N'-diacetyllegionaminate synthase
VSVFIIAEAGSCHDNDLQKAFRLIHAAKDCGADAVKFQFWSSSKRLAERRKMPQNEPIYAKCKIPMTWLLHLSQRCQLRDIEFMCSTFLPEDIGVMAPFVKRFKISAFEYADEEFQKLHDPYMKQVIVSVNPGQPNHRVISASPAAYIHCVSKYPTTLDQLQLSTIRNMAMDGFSDHSTSVLTGSWAVIAGAKIIEKHIRLTDTFADCPDYPHSLQADWTDSPGIHFKEYVKNIRQAERAL